MAAQVTYRYWHCDETYFCVGIQAPTWLVIHSTRIGGVCCNIVFFGCGVGTHNGLVLAGPDILVVQAGRTVVLGGREVRSGASVCLTPNDMMPSASFALSYQESNTGDLAQLEVPHVNASLEPFPSLHRIKLLGCSSGHCPDNGQTPVPSAL